MASQVEIYLPQIQGEWIHAFTIPSAAIKRFTVRPLKWLRFTTFAICGIKGHLSAVKGDNEIVDYNVTFDDLTDRYFYIPDNDEYHFVDFKAFNTRFTSSALTPRHLGFRNKIVGRDVGCVVTGFGPVDCYVSHIIPRCKGNSYLTFLIRDRTNLYGELPPSLREDIDIDCIENGMLLRTELHKMFDSGRIGFLNTPNFAMTPADVPRVEDEDGPIPDRRTTLHYIVPPLPEGRGKIPQWDFLGDWSPPSILLDFMYGAAVAKRWKSDRLHAMLDAYFEATFSPALAKINPPPATPPLEDDKPDDPDWQFSSQEEAREAFTPTRSTDFLNIMDRMLFLPMLLKGIPPEEAAMEMEKQRREAELCFQEHGREKAQQWLNAQFDSMWHFTLDVLSYQSTA